MSDKSNKAKMLAGELYRADDPELVTDLERAEMLLKRFNDTTSRQAEDRRVLLNELLGSASDGVVVKPRFACDYGYNIRLGRNVFVNYGCVFLDCAAIEVGDDVQMAPHVQLYTAGHPLDADVRRSGLEFAKPIRIERDAWLGGGVIVLPGVTIGQASVIGAGSVVTRDIPAHSLAVGNPAHVVRNLGSGD